MTHVFRSPSWWRKFKASSNKLQAASLKQQAKPEPSSGSEDSSRKLQASSDMNQTQVSSHKLQAQ